MGRSGKDSAAVVVGIAILGILGLAIQYWYVVLPLAGGVVWLSLNSSRAAAKRAADNEHKLQVLKLAQALQNDLEYATKGKSLKTRLNNCDDALRVLAELEQLDGETNIVGNKKEIRDKVELLKRTLPILDLIEKQRKYQFTGDSRRELKAIKEILYYVQVNKISDADLSELDFVEGASEPSSIEILEKRAQELESPGPPA